MTETLQNPIPWFVDFQDVWLAYNEQLLQENHFAVEAIDLKVRQGEFIAIVGPSGCGKSTFMKLTTGLKMPSMGKILIDGQPVTGPLKISGMAFQAPSLLPWRTTVDNVLLPLEIVEPFRSNFKAKRKEYEESAPASCCKRSGWGATKTSFRGSCRAACSSAPAFVGR
jgi:NitT/TauT family transport system ATP-binding protein